MRKLMSSLLAVAIAATFSMPAFAAEHGTATPATMPAASAAPAAEKPAEAPKKVSKKTHKSEEKKAGAPTGEAPTKK